MFIVACTPPPEEIIQEGSVQDIDELVEESAVGTQEPVGSANIEKMIIVESSDEVVGPGGCTGDSCNEYFIDNPQASQNWCDENPVKCQKLKGNSQVGLERPGNCGNNCQKYCNENNQECQEWCKNNSAKNPELCGFMAMGDERAQRQGDGIWEKDELTFYVKDTEGVLTAKKKEVITGTITSQKKIGSAFLGWNAALQDLNRMYPDNIVPNKLIEVTTENHADIIIQVHSEKEYCCDLAGLPVKGIERSTIDDNSVKEKSDISIYNIVKMDLGFLEDISMHELGHTLGLFGHVTDRSNDLMSIISPGSGIKEGNLNDLYVKYRDRIIETVEATRQRDQGVQDRIVAAPD
jgi:hypothetical protein